jgi:stage II sporulation protein P
MHRQPPQKQFRSMTFNVGDRKMRTLVIIMSVGVAALFLFLSVIAIQLMAATNENSFASRMLHSVSNQSLNSIMSHEIPVFASADPNMVGHPKEPRSKWSSILFYLFTDIDVEHPESMLGGSIAAMAASNFEPLNRGFEEPPGEDKLPAAPDQKEQPPAQTEEPKPIQPDGKPIVYIYHTHNRESYLPDLPGMTEPNQAYDKDKNITLVGERLLKALKDKNINAIQTKNDYWYKGDVKNEYDLSRKTVKEVLAKYDSLKMVFDIHRDSGSRENTTAKINGQDVAKVFFIIGGSNENWQKNSEFAIRIHNKLEQMYPGVSKGAHKNIFTNPNYDSRYNQDLSPNSIIIEIGGPENSMEEAYRTADLLANVIAELVKDEQNAKQK